MYVSPRYDHPDAHNVYDVPYFEYSLLAQWPNRKTFEKRLDLLERNGPTKGRLLDVGCSVGQFMEIARERGWEPHGVDITDHFADRIRRRAGVSIRVGDFLHVPCESASFDAVHMGDSIEHMLDPAAVIRKVCDILKPGGVGYVRAPDCGHIAPRLFGRRWIQIKPDEHLYYFNRRTMRRMLEAAGLTVLVCRSSRAYFTVETFSSRVGFYYPAARCAAGLLIAAARAIGVDRARFPVDLLEEFEILFRKPAERTGTGGP